MKHVRALTPEAGSLGPLATRCRRWPALVVVLLTCAATRTAHAVACNTLPSPVYGIGGSGPLPLFAKLGKALSAASPPQTIVYQSPGACVGAQSILSGTLMTGMASYWDSTGAQQSCALTITGQAPDFGAGALYPSTCPGVPSTLPTTFGDFKGPVEPFDFIVPKSSTVVQVISGPAAYFVYGFGAQSQAAPWTDVSEIFNRNANSAAAQILARAINVPVASFQGTDAVSSGNMITEVVGAPVPSNALGFVSNEVASMNLSSISVLAYQHYDQTCGYWPSSSAMSGDLLTVLNGKYALWSSLHFYATVNGAGTITDPAASQLIGYLTGTSSPPTGVNVPAIVAQVGEVLDCAMEVSRASDFGDFMSYAPAAPCGCFFEAQATGTSTCTACTADATCPRRRDALPHGLLRGPLMNQRALCAAAVFALVTVMGCSSGNLARDPRTGEAMPSRCMIRGNGTDAHRALPEAGAPDGKKATTDAAKDAGQDAGRSPDAGGPDAAADASCSGADACYACSPATTIEFLNACTSAQCLPFDNTARLPLYNGGNLPPLPP